MRHIHALGLFLGIGTFSAGCIPAIDSGPGGEVLGALIGAEPSTSATGDSTPAGRDSSTPPTSIAGSVHGAGQYQLFELGATAAGDQWIVSSRSVPASSSFTLVLLNSSQDLVMRSIMSEGAAMSLVSRRGSDKLFLGVAPAANSPGGDFEFSIRKESGKAVPAPAAQSVFLNFGAGSNESVHRRPGISFSAFDGAALGAAYAGKTQALKDAIVRIMRADYAAYNVTIVSSDEGPPPTGQYATIHFGGDDDGLLGLADNVDMYNQDPAQSAVIYVQAFAPYEIMELDADEMGLMIGNVASHELGHLLGLFHTRNPSDVMDTTGSSWDLASDQQFSRVALEASVFPTGMGNSPMLLEDTVGVRSASIAALSEPTSTAKLGRRALIRGFVQEEIRNACGTCLHLDE